MIVSSALPIQFWAVDEETYNEKEVCGIEEFCWCAPVEWGDEITIQFTDDPGQTLLLFLMTEDDDNAERETFVEISSGVYEATITIPNLNKEAQLLIREDGSILTANIITNSSFSGGLAPWVNQTDGGVDWDNVVAGKARAFSLDTGQFSNRLLQTFSDTSASDVLETSIAAMVDSGFGNASSGYVRFYFYKDGSELTELRADVPFQTTDANPFFTINPRFFIENQSIDAVAFSFHVIESVGGVSIEFADYGIAVLSGYDILQRSDCIKIQETQECTELITYSNNKNFAGIVYEGITPQPTFSLRVPVVFFHESFPQEEEVHPKSDDTWIRLSSRMERKKLFDIGYIPYYMHQKIQLILMHDNIEIQGEQWKKRDAYNIEEAHKRYPKPKANVLLTDKNFIIRNLI